MEFILALIVVIIAYIVGSFVAVLKLPRSGIKILLLLGMVLAVIIPTICIIIDMAG